MYINSQNVELRLTGKATNVLTSTSSRDMLHRSGRNDLFHLATSDVAYGGTGDDRYYIFDSTPVIVEKGDEGLDTVYARFWGTATLADNVENLI